MIKPFFDTDKVNWTYDAVPAARQAARWAEITPDGFTFDVKLHRLLSRHSADERSLPPALRTGASGRESATSYSWPSFWIAARRSPTPRSPTT